MKKLFATLFALLVITAFTFAETGYELYKMKNIAEADIVLSALSTELQLPAEQIKEIRQLLYSTVKAESELLAKAENGSSEAMEGILRRHTGHVEGNLEQIVGKETYQLYLQHKATIELKTKAAGKE